MSKAVMISIQPRWCELIANGEKTIEVRKTRPKLETPFKCYIYCTSGDDKLWIADAVRRNWWGNTHVAHLCNAKDCGGMNLGNRKVIGEFVCDRIDTIRKRGIPENFDYCYLSLNEWGNDDVEIEIRDIARSQVSKKELNEYSKNVPVLYAWHISGLKIYDKPKKISEFKKHNRECYFDNLGMATPKCSECTTCNLTRPPQSWCYVEELRT